MKATACVFVCLLSLCFGHLCEVSDEHLEAIQNANLMHKPMCLNNASSTHAYSTRIDSRHFLKYNDSCKCESGPRDFLLDVEVPEPYMIFTPLKVVVKRCFGVCRDRFYCYVDEQKKRNVTVQVIDDNDKIREVDITVTDHVGCKCSCNMEVQMNCNDEIHMINKETCSCPCKNGNDVQKCKNQNKVLNDMTCKCECQKKCDDEDEEPNPETCECESDNYVEETPYEK